LVRKQILLNDHYLKPFLRKANVQIKIKYFSQLLWL